MVLNYYKGGVIMKINLSSFLQWRFNLFLCRILGWRFTFFYMSLLGRVYYFFNRKEKWAIEKAVKAVFAERKSRLEIKSTIRRVFHGILAHYYEKFFNAFSTNEAWETFLATHTENEGMDVIEKGLSRGKGVLLITGHFGGVEFIPGYLAVNNYPVTIVVKFSSNQLRKISNQRADEFAARFIDPDRTPNIMKAIFDNLKENRIVITQCDEIDEWKPCRHKNTFFLGRQVRLDRTINILSKRCTAAIVFAVMHRDRNHRYKFIATSSEEMAKRFQRSIDMPIGAVILKFMEQYIYKYPEEWYQWKKYPALEAFSCSGVRTDTPTSIPLLGHSMGKAA